MALQTKDVEVAGFEQMRIGRAVWRVTRLAALDLSAGVLEDEWPLLVHVAREADGIPPCRRTQLLSEEAAMRVVTIRTVHEPFLNAVMKGHIELRFHLQMAAVAQLGLCFNQQELLCAGMMGGVTVQATYIAFAVSRAGEIHVILPRYMALKTPLAYFFG